MLDSPASMRSAPLVLARPTHPTSTADRRLRGRWRGSTSAADAARRMANASSWRRPVSVRDNSAIASGGRSWPDRLTNSSATSIWRHCRSTPKWHMPKNGSTSLPAWAAARRTIGHSEYCQNVAARYTTKPATALDASHSAGCRPCVAKVRHTTQRNGSRNESVKFLTRSAPHMPAPQLRGKRTAKRAPHCARPAPFRHARRRARHTTPFQEAMVLARPGEQHKG